MQRATALHSLQGGLSTFAIDLQAMTDQFSEMPRPRQVIRLDMLRGKLAGRYGTGAGRQSMGNRAESVEALMGAFSECQEGGELFQETAEDVEWIDRWWKIMESAMREEESLLSRAQCSMPAPDPHHGKAADQATKAAVTQMDSVVPSSTGSVVDPGDQEREVLREVEAWNRSQQERVAREQYEELRADEELEDVWAWEAKEELEILEAERREDARVDASSVSTQQLTPEENQRWDDWAMASELGVASPPKRRRVTLRVRSGQAQGGSQVLSLGDVPMGQPTQLALTVTLDGAYGGLGETASSSTDSVSVPAAQLVPFLESNMGALIFEWWKAG